MYQIARFQIQLKLSYWKPFCSVNSAYLITQLKQENYIIEYFCTSTYSGVRTRRRGHPKQQVSHVWFCYGPCAQYSLLNTVLTDIIQGSQFFKVSI